MYKIEIITIGKNKKNWLDCALEEYQKRLSHNFSFNWVFAKDNHQLTRFCLQKKPYIALDPNGIVLDSPKFAKKWFSLLESYGSRLTLVIGGAEGLDSLIKQNADALISFSALTFTHQICRLILLEQIYRSDQIIKNTAYHK